VSDQAAAQLRFRRALSLLAMTVVLPGSAQLVAGNRRIGVVALRCAFGLLVLTLLLGVAAWLDSGLLVGLATDPRALLGTRLVLMALAVGWVLLLLDAWRLGDPPGLPRRPRLALAGVSTVLVALLTSMLLFSAHVVAVQRSFIVSVFGDGTAADPVDGRYTVLLLGGDSGPNRWGVRPDSVTLASIDEDTGRTVLFGLPRNLADVPFPEGTPMHEQFPDGFDCDGCYLNSVYTYALEHPELFPGEADPGLAATRQAVEGVTGLPVNYYAMVNLKGFTELVDAVGGVTVHVRDTVAIGGGGGAVTGTIEPGTRHLDGYQTLWFARSREFDDDYSRMARQKCVLNAMLQQLSPQQVLLNVQEIAEAGQELLSTDIPASELDRFVDLALKARTQPISTVSFVPPAVDTSDPDYAAIHDTVDDALARAEGDAPADRSGRPHRHRSANSSGDLAGAC
jgi:polyisoprenyl-teichoic acid--peptidoglycan teichoic acid transferase